MSYCRWSSNDHQCDLYVYDSPGGVTIHVASNRYGLARPLPQWVSPLDDPLGFFERHHVVARILDESDLVPIGGPHDGQTFIAGDGHDAAEIVAMLAGQGYQMPAGVVEALRRDALEGEGKL